MRAVITDVSGTCRHLSRRRDQVQVPQPGLHGLVAAQDVLHISRRLHTRRTGDHHHILLYQRCPRRLATGSCRRHDERRGCGTEADGSRRPVPWSGQDQDDQSETSV
jgi:hypothetical protein